MEHKTETKENIVLGGNIELNGFQGVEIAKMVVLKKLVGNYARQISEKAKDYEKLTLTLEGDQNDPSIKAELKAGDSKTGEGKANNLFMAVDAALKKVIEQL